MKLRKLKIEDAEFMFEWMRDDSIVRDLQTDFLKMNIDDCNKFIVRAREQYTEKNPHYLHFAIIDEDSEDFDEYLGTVSLKNINYDYGRAEFAITIRHKAMGRGLARLAMQEIIDIGFEHIGLKGIYWYVSTQNIRANKFYEKNGYKGGSYEEFCLWQEGNKIVTKTDTDPEKYIWYYVKNKEKE